MIDRILTAFKPKPKEKEFILKIGPLSVAVDLQYRDQINLTIPIQNTEYNLKTAESVGFKPLSLKKVIEQIKPKFLKNAVFFDTSVIGVYPGNHWRIHELNKEKGSASLQLCTVFGIDYSAIPPISFPPDLPMFTGVSIQKFELGGMPVSLGEVTQALKNGKEGEVLNYPKSLKYKGETILWSNFHGTLVTAEKHPFLKQCP